MASVTIYYFNSPAKEMQNGNFPISLKVTNKGKRRYYGLNKNCHPSQWDEVRKEFNKTYPKYKKENSAMKGLLRKAEDIILDFEKFGITFSFEAFEEKYLGKEKNNVLAGYYQFWIDRLKNEGKISTVSPYISTKNAISEFAESHKKYKKKALVLSDITVSFLEDFEHFLRTKRGLKDTSISTYMRNLRTVINKAIKKDKIMDKGSYPFDDYQVSKLDTKTEIDALTRDEVKAIEALNFPDHSKLQFAQHIFLFSYYTKGMNFIDVANLTTRNIKKGRIEYKRGKVKEMFSLKILPQAQKILDFYLKHKFHIGETIFPVFDATIHITPQQLYDRKKTALRAVNKALKKIAEILGLDCNKLTSNVGRHSYANVLKNNDVSAARIQESMGHTTERTTRIYLNRFGNEKLDEIDEKYL